MCRSVLWPHCVSWAAESCIQLEEKGLIMCLCAVLRAVYQIFAFIGICESFSYEKCFYGQPGDGNLGFDPLGMGKNPASLTYYKVCNQTSFLHQIPLSCL